MATPQRPTGPTPPRDEAVPGSYALRVTGERIHVWTYRPDAIDPDWDHVESLPSAESPRLTLEFAEPTPPDGGGYWVYARSYDCSLGCGTARDGDDGDA